MYVVTRPEHVQVRRVVLHVLVLVAVRQGTLRKPSAVRVVAHRKQIDVMLGWQESRLHMSGLDGSACVWLLSTSGGSVPHQSSALELGSNPITSNVDCCLAGRRGHRLGDAAVQCQGTSARTEVI